jgi:hypothetical protein
MSDEKMRLTKEGQLQLKGGDNSYIKCGPNTNNYYLNVGSSSNSSKIMYDSICCGFGLLLLGHCSNRNIC